MRVQILPSSLSSGNQPQMVAPETSRVRRGQQAIYEHSERYPPLMYRITERYSLFPLISQAVSETGEREEDTEKGARAHEGEKIPVVSSSDAVVDPYTMVVLCFYAAITYSAMVTSRWPPNIARLTVLCRYVHGAIGSPSRLYRSPLCSGRPQSERVVRVFRGRYRVEISRQNLSVVREDFQKEPFIAHPRVCYGCMYK